MLQTWYIGQGSSAWCLIFKASAVFLARAAVRAADALDSVFLLLVDIQHILRSRTSPPSFWWDCRCRRLPYGACDKRQIVPSYKNSHRKQKMRCNCVASHFLFQYLSFGRIADIYSLTCSGGKLSFDISAHSKPSCITVWDTKPWKNCSRIRDRSFGLPI